ncbi:hypothetical protein L484_006351 [Morus notabilis]|uniref:Uncharacterized protein n=1 Tax=Morus notabilis TaxID=981085 RepID=W9R050_9ROSA|nr:uncharacterized protein LOC21389782 [Morus notabilis]EXB49813.1 hypothetical protein L484_006351 [Morus notabilis]
MDSDDDYETRASKRNFPFLILRWSLALILHTLSFFVLSFFVGLVAIFLANSSVSSPISVPSQCKIVSSSVDLRSSKVCELGLLNYKAKHVFYPFGKNKFRCRYDYYWASVFKVEYKDLSSGVNRFASAEAPNEALPLNCRPNFGAAWLNKDKFKVNETYDCWYTHGIPKVSLPDDGFFSCQANDPSTFEMIKRYSILSVKVLQSWLLSREKSKHWRWDVLAGVFVGFSTSLISITFVVFLRQLKSSLFSAAKSLLRAFLRITFTRACFLVVYFSVMAWLAVQYGKRIGLLEIFTIFNS